MKLDLVDIDGGIQYETEKAYLFTDGEHTVWLPKSQCEWDEQDKKMTMPVWLAMEKALI